MKKFTVIATVVAAVITQPLQAQVNYGEVPAMYQTGGWVNTRKNQKLPAAANPVSLPRAQPTEQQRDIIEQARRLSQHDSNLAVLLVEKGQLIFESHNYPSREQNPLHSHSMSKTLTAFTIGNMYCDGKIGSLDQPAETYAPMLRGTVYGEATVKNLLTMSSGAKRPSLGSGERKPYVWRDITQGQFYSGMDYVQEFKDRDSGFFGTTKSGSSFVYSNTDTLALGFVAESNGGFIEMFNRYLWSKIGAEAPGYWLTDKDNRAVTYSGFNATARDWAKLAVYTLGQLKRGDSCIKNFMREATSPQLPNYDNVGKSFRNYGYQTWVGNFGPRSSYWFNGFAGQRIGVDPETERILIVFSWRENYMDQVYDLFARWQRQ